MKGTDKFLISIVAGVIVLVVAVLVVVLLQPNQPSYRSDDTPEGAAHNYLLALELEEYDRAYGYLSSTLPGYPVDVDAFERDTRQDRWNFGYYDDDVSLEIESAKVSGDRAKIVVRKTEFYFGSLFDSGQHSSTFDMSLRREEDAWKISYSVRYWADCWEAFKGCQ